MGRCKRYLTPRIQMTHILEDLTHKMKGQPHKKKVSWVLSIHFLYTLENDHGTQRWRFGSNDFPFQLDEFQGSCQFSGVYIPRPSKCVKFQPVQVFRSVLGDFLGLKFHRICSVFSWVWPVCGGVTISSWFWISIGHRDNTTLQLQNVKNQIIYIK